MEDRKPYIVFDKKEYKELIEIAERVSTLERLIKSSSYVSIEDVKTILGIGEEKADG